MAESLPTQNISTGTSARTTFSSPGTFEGHMVWVSDSEPVCAPYEHDLFEVDHYGQLGTGYVMCDRCCGWGDDPR